jgi:hypothetical protein
MVTDSKNTDPKINMSLTMPDNKEMWYVSDLETFRDYTNRY